MNQQRITRFSITTVLVISAMLASQDAKAWVVIQQDGHHGRGHHEKSYQVANRHEERFDRRHERREDRRHDRYFDRRNYGHNFHREYLWMPFGHITIQFGGRPYYYFDGCFYRRHEHKYVRVERPPLVMVEHIPDDYYLVVVQGRPLYTNGFSYYQQTPQGYIMIDRPSTGVYVSPAQTTEIKVKKDLNKVTINIPLEDGGYKAITLKKTDDGFVGPQGELYDEFPSVDELKVVYAKS